MSNDRETSDNLVEIVKKSCDLAKERFDADIYAVVSDNARNMVSMGAKLPPTLMFTTCNSHTGNLLAKDFVGTKKYAGILNKVMSVQKDFKRPKLEVRLVSAGGNKAVLYSLIRFASSRNTIKSFLDNFSFMKKVAADDQNPENIDEGDSEAVEDAIAKRPSPAVTRLIFNDEFVESVMKMLEIMDPIGQLINVCQKSTSSIADAIEEWVNLLHNASPELKSIVDTRCRMSNVFKDITLIAHFLRPVYRGQKFTNDQSGQVSDFIFGKLDAEGLESFRLFSSGDGICAALNSKKITSPKTYWFYAMRQHKQLAEIATQLLLIPALTAQLERLFSNCSFVHSKTRNRLSVETSSKLINIYFSLRENDYFIDEEDDNIEN